MCPAVYYHKYNILHDSLRGKFQVFPILQHSVLFGTCIYHLKEFFFGVVSAGNAD